MMIPVSLRSVTLALVCGIATAVAAFGGATKAGDPNPTLQDGEAVSQRPVSERKERLRTLLSEPVTLLQFSDHQIGRGQAFYEQANRFLTPWLPMPTESRQPCAHFSPTEAGAGRASNTSRPADSDGKIHRSNNPSRPADSVST
jgi:hypothetical protein